MFYLFICILIFIYLFFCKYKTIVLFSDLILLLQYHIDFLCYFFTLTHTLFYEFLRTEIVVYSWLMCFILLRGRGLFFQIWFCVKCGFSYSTFIYLIILPVLVHWRGADIFFESGTNSIQ